MAVALCLEGITWNQPWNQPLASSRVDSVSCKHQKLAPCRWTCWWWPVAGSPASVSLQSHEPSPKYHHVLTSNGFPAGHHFFAHRRFREAIVRDLRQQQWINWPAWQPAQVAPLRPARTTTTSSPQMRTRPMGSCRRLEGQDPPRSRDSLSPCCGQQDSASGTGPAPGDRDPRWRHVPVPDGCEHDSSSGGGSRLDM